MVTASVNNAIKIPLKIRLIAWWNGYDIDDLKDRMLPRSSHKDDDKSDQVALNDSLQKKMWDAACVKGTQMIWGDGFCGPGGEQNVIDMSKLLALTPKMSAIDIGAGLGGPARVLAQKFGVWISGYESNQLLAEEGTKLSVAKGLEKKAPIIHRDLNDSPTFDRSFDRAFSKEILFTVENKTALIKSIFDQLKDDGLFLISDFVVRDHDSLSHPDVLNWVKQEPHSAFPMTSETMKYTLEKAGFQTRIHEDITAPYLDMINAAWVNAIAAVESLSSDDGEEAQKTLHAIQKEAELWGRRVKILRTGELRLYRYLAHKPVQTDQEQNITAA